MSDDKLTKFLKKTKPKKTRPRPKLIIKKSSRHHLHHTYTKKRIKSKETEKTMFKAPFSDEHHSYGRKIVDADGKLVCYLNKSKSIDDRIRFVLDALTGKALLVSGTLQVDDDVKEPEAEVKLPEHVTEALDTIKEHIIDQGDALRAQVKKLDDARDALGNL